MKTIKAWAIVDGGKLYRFVRRASFHIFGTRKAAINAKQEWQSIVRVEIKSVKRRKNAH